MSISPDTPQPAPPVPRRESGFLSAVWFLQYAAVGLMTMLPLVLITREIEAYQIGFLNAAFNFAGVLTQFAIGNLSDRLQRRRPFIIWPTLLMSAVYLMLFTTYGFLGVAILFFIAGACMHGATTAVTAAIADWSAASRTTASAFSSTRIWGSVGFVLSLVCLSPWLESDALVVGGIAIFLFLTALAAVPLREPALHTQAAPEIKGRIRELFRDSNLMVFLICFLLFKMAESASMSFFALRMDELGGTRQLVAWALAINAVFEIPLIRLAGPWSERVGRRPIILIALMVFPLRLIGYALIPGAWYVFPIQLFHGCTYGFMLVGAVAFVNDRAPGNLRATAQGLLGMTQALGMSLGPFLGGLIAHAIGLGPLYIALAGLVLFALLVFSLLVHESRHSTSLHEHPLLDRVAGRPFVNRR